MSLLVASTLVSLGKVRNLPLEVRAPPGQAPHNKVEVTDNYKHSSLLRYGINRTLKSFIAQTRDVIALLFNEIS
jgi:hypothetical protein